MLIPSANKNLIGFNWKNLFGKLTNFDNTSLRKGDDFSHIWNLGQVYITISEEIVLLTKPITILGY